MKTKKSIKDLTNEEKESLLKRATELFSNNVYQRCDTIAELLNKGLLGTCENCEFEPFYAYYENEKTANIEDYDTGEVYQYWSINEHFAKFLSKYTDQYIAYVDELELYIWASNYCTDDDYNKLLMNAIYESNTEE